MLWRRLVPEVGIMAAINSEAHPRKTEIFLNTSLLNNVYLNH